MTVTVTLNGRATDARRASRPRCCSTSCARDGLRSVRATCGIGVCGACTVLLDGEPVSGCLTMAAPGARAAS